MVPGYRAGVNACLHLTPNTIMSDSGGVKAMHTSRCTSWRPTCFPKEPLIGYLRLAAGQELGQAPIQVLGETLPQSAARRCRWCGSLMACVSSGAVRGVAEKGSVLLEVAVPSLLIIPMDKQEGTGGSHHWNGPAQAIGHD